MRPFLRPSWPKRSPILAWLPRTTPHRVSHRIATTSARHAAPVDVPSLVVSPGSKHHNSLPSFLEWAERTGRSLASAVSVGTLYEYMSALALMRLGFSLIRVGRGGDAGIDLIGHWVLTRLREPMPIIVQCKSRKISCNPGHIRELEGSFQGIPPAWRNKDVMGLLVTTKKATTGVLRALGQSQWPMGFVLVSREGLIEQFVWNRMASEKGLEGVGVTLRHTPRALLVEPGEEVDEDEKVSTKIRAKFKNAGTMKDIQLTWMGSPIFPDRVTLDQETVKLIRQITPSEEEDLPVVEVEKKPRGRPKGSTKEAMAEKVVKKPRPVGRPVKTWSQREPIPRGGRIPENIKVPTTGHITGRPSGSRDKSKRQQTKSKPPPPELVPTVSKRPVGRPRLRPPIVRCARVGRPAGSKAKPKAPADTG
ncbi:hypothetical protein CUC08_Gglean011267 [Alternaria sp. MG1]|uniref:Restriction endonuclease type IV Mrr domain-containing protein n=1 Tax=Alternaria tenuissima TaxID=119927 RepID=A0ABY0GMA8_9PLEO|nr:hypothetical protein CUC08_Gglean011267 [Alternaria sp. MG1]RYO08173.1 hypothetical protein AA0119_g1524 [Alternaria tenuissima]RYO23680.1 hypothetical protein AA0121_g1621 [Alternaria tenuissima]